MEPTSGYALLSDQRVAYQVIGDGPIDEAGKVTLLIDRSYPLGETADAIGYFEEGHARGKVVITVENNSRTQNNRST